MSPFVQLAIAWFVGVLFAIPLALIINRIARHRKMRKLFEAMAGNGVWRSEQQPPRPPDNVSTLTKR